MRPTVAQDENTRALRENTHALKGFRETFACLRPRGLLGWHYYRGVRWPRLWHKLGSELVPALEALGCSQVAMGFADWALFFAIWVEVGHV